MKIRHPQNPSTMASSMVVTLMLCSILSFTILGYLALIEQQAKLGGRSQAWNMAISVVEAGIEDALQHLNNNTTNLSADGWQQSGSFYWKSNTLAGGQSYYARVWPSNLITPMIVCQSYMGSLLLAGQPPQPMFAASGVSIEPPSVSRAIRVHCWRGSLFIKALAAKHLIDMNGNDILTDSFDSDDPNFSAFGGQYDPAKAKDNGDVASNDTLVNVGNANIYGHVATGPGGTVYVGTLGGVGPHWWQPSHPGEKYNDWVTDDSNFTFPDTTIPYTSGLDPTGGDVVETSFVIITNRTTSSEPPTGMPWGGIQSNVVQTTEVTSLPDPIPPGLSTNAEPTTTSYYPAHPPAGGVRTNVAGSMIVSTWPGDNVGPIVTNPPTWVTVGSYPNPPPPGIQTNLVWVKDKPYPTEGHYVGQIYTNGANYSFWWIASYKYPVYTYTYYTYTFTYAVYKYIIPTFSYSYNLYTTNTIYTTNYYDHILHDGKYYIDVLSGKTIVLGKAELVCANGINMTGSDVIKVAKGGSITNWVGGTSVSITGNGVVNETGIAANYVCLAAPSVKTLALGGNGEFIGVLVAPEADAQLSGGGRAVFDFIGCLMVNSVKMNGHFRFHYDEALGRRPGNGRYLITAWDEIPPPW